MNAPAPTACIVIPARNEGARLRRCLETAGPAAAARGWELVVVDDGSEDDTAGVAESMGARVVRHARSRGVAAARNRGAQETGAKILVFLDADVVAPAATLYALVDRLVRDESVHATGAYPEVGDLSPEWSAHFVGLRTAFAHHRLPREEVEGYSSFQSECGAIRREVFEEVGGFPEDYAGVGMEEFQLAHEMDRRGYVNLLLADAAYAHHYKTLTRRRRQLIVRTSRWTPLLLSRRRFESSRSTGSASEALSCALSALMLCGAAAGAFCWAGWALAVAAGVAQVALERKFFQLARRTYGAGMALFAWPALQVYHAAIGIGFALGLARAAAGKARGRRG